MNLHSNKGLFLEVLSSVEAETGIPEEYIEKDYFVSLLLRNIVEAAPNIVFKGGTSLSKCYQIIKRFSEDIDINYKVDAKPTQGQMIRLKNTIVGVIENSNMILTNPEKIKSKGSFNEYLIEFPRSVEIAGALKDHLIIETHYFHKSFPCEKKPVSNYILEYLTSQGEMGIVEEYKLQSFEINVQKVDRTFIDKVFAICDFYEGDKATENSRHLYDLHMIWTNNLIEKEKFAALFEQVAIERASGKGNTSSENGYQIIYTLTKIIESIQRDPDRNRIVYFQGTPRIERPILDYGLHQ